MKDPKYSRLAGMDVRNGRLGGKDARSVILIGRLGERMNDKEYSHLGGSGENWKYSRLVGMDGRLEILKVWWQYKIGKNQG